MFQEARILFNLSPIKPRKCRALLTKIDHILNTGEHFSKREATELFFSITKLFQHKDVCLKKNWGGESLFIYLFVYFFFIKSWLT